MGKPFEIVLQRVQGTGSVLSLERSLDQSICKNRIFGQDRAMAVGTESIFVPHTFGPVLSVISITFDDLPQRADTCSQKGAPAVVFKAHDRAAPGFLSQPESIVSDHAFLTSDRVKIDGAQSGQAGRESLQAVTAAAICNASFPDIFCAFSS